MTVLLPLLVAVVGLVVYALSTNPKAAEVGRLAFATGLLVTLFDLARLTLNLLH